MNTNETTSPSNPATNPTAPSTDQDPRSGFGRAAEIAASVLADVTTEDLRKPTPCSEFDVEALTRHLISVLHRVVALGEGNDAETIPLDAPGVKTGDWMSAWGEGIENYNEAWADPAVLGREMVLPWGTLPGAPTLAIYTAEVLVHTWDLARAVGLDVDWDPELAEVAFQTLSFGIPAEGRGTDVPFDPVVPTADDAPAMDRLVAWVGRTP